MGVCSGVTLAMARKAAWQLRSKISVGIEPLQERKVHNDEFRAAQRKRLLFVDFSKTSKLKRWHKRQVIPPPAQVWYNVTMSLQA